MTIFSVKKYQKLYVLDNVMNNESPSTVLEVDSQDLSMNEYSSMVSYHPSKNNTKLYIYEKWMSIKEEASESMSKLVVLNHMINARDS